VTTIAPGTASCYAHPASPPVGECRRCDRAICTTCAFEGVGDGGPFSGPTYFCADCMLAGPTAEQQRGAFVFGLGSIACFGLTVFLLGASILAVAAELVPAPREEFLWGVVGVVKFGLVLTGISLGLIGREKGRRGGALLALLGLIGNSALLLLLLGFAIAGSATKG